MRGIGKLAENNGTTPGAARSGASWPAGHRSGDDENPLPTEQVALTAALDCDAVWVEHR